MFLALVATTGDYIKFYPFAQFSMDKRAVLEGGTIGFKEDG